MIIKNSNRSERVRMQLLLNFYGQTTVLYFEDARDEKRKVRDVKQAFSRKKFEKLEGDGDGEGMPALHLSLNGKYLYDTDCIGDEYDVSTCVFRVTVSGALKGGKGGFGAMLRAQSKKKSKKTMDFGACRDLSGRRLRHVNDEILLKKWQDAKDNDKEFDVTEPTQTGIDLWYLNTPGWADTGSYKPSKRKIALAPKLKSQLCKNWLDSCARRKSGKPPPGAPVAWGCPKGARCEFAHGEADLNEASMQALKEDRDKEGKAKKEDDKRTYMKDLDGESDMYMRDVISAGLGAAKRMKKEADAEASLVSKGEDGGVESTVHDGKKTETSDEKEIGADDGHNDDDDDDDEDNDEEDAFKPTECYCSWMTVLAGTMKVTEDLNVEGYSAFSTVAVENCALGEGKWYYEAEILTLGLMQIGWANSDFQLSSDSTDGVGDDVNSYSYDGSRQMKWNKENEVYGLQWKVGDIIGCCLDITFGYVDIMYYLNGDVLGSAFFIPRDENSSITYYPVVSLEAGEKMKLNIGQMHFKHMPVQEGFVSVQSALMEKPTDDVSKIHVDDDEIVDHQKTFTSVDLESEDYSSVEKLELLGLAHLKAELSRRGLKSGGNLLDRAQRLYSVRGLSFDQIDNKLKQKK